MTRSGCDLVQLYTEEVAGERTGIIEATGSPGSIEKIADDCWQMDSREMGGQ